MGFRNMGNFNVALLAKQGWRLMQYPDSLVARILKAKYYPDLNFVNSSLGYLPSFTWKSIWASKGMLQEGLRWRVGLGRNIMINGDS